MKNLHILSTDKPSSLIIYNSKLKLVNYPVITPSGNQKHVYITSDEKIKNRDWYIADNKVYRASVDHMPELYTYSCKKIILTTDDQLIKDGVQAIDDEFLNWFVKNPSCERVRVGKFVSGKYFCTNPIISKEEPKTMLKSLQEYLKNTPKEKVIEDWNEFQHLDDEGITVKEFLENQKQETLEEFSRRRFNEQKLDTYTSYNIEDAIKEGAKWQQQQMYSEEYVLKIIDLLFHKYASSFRIDAKEDFLLSKNK